jgi:hypothetical protein
MAAAHFDKTFGEVSGGEHRELLARLHEISQRRFHTGAAGTRNDLDERILRAENRTQIAANVFRNLEEIRIQMADYRLPHGLIDTGMNLRGTGGEQQPARRIQLGHEIQVYRAQACPRDFSRAVSRFRPSALGLAEPAAGSDIPAHLLQA